MSEIDFRAVLKNTSRQEMGIDRRKVPRNYKSTIQVLLVERRQNYFNPNRKFRAKACFLCEESLPTTFDLKNHLTEKHNLKKLHQIFSGYPWCERCGQNFENLQETAIFHQSINYTSNCTKFFPSILHRDSIKNLYLESCKNEDIV